MKRRVNTNKALKFLSNYFCFTISHRFHTDRVLFSLGGGRGKVECPEEADGVSSLLRGKSRTFGAGRSADSHRRVRAPKTGRVTTADGRGRTTPFSPPPLTPLIPPTSPDPRVRVAQVTSRRRPSETRPSSPKFRSRETPRRRDR